MHKPRGLTRRDVLQFGAATATLPLTQIHRAGAKANRVLRFTLNEDLSVLDPHWTPQGPTRLHAFAVFDTLFGMDSSHKVSPQMVEGALVEDDGKRWILTLRDGMKFHDGEPVLARDCVASIRRWVPFNSFGQELMAATDDVAAADDRRIVFRLKRRFPRLPDALGTPTEAVPAIMPERLANSGNVQIKEIIGSGPFRFKADERLVGSRTVYERFADYRPREGGVPDWTAGPKIVHLDRIEWTVIPDASTRAAALQNREIDWWGIVVPDLIPQLRHVPEIKLEVADSLGHMLTLVMNHLQLPFSNPDIRHALLRAVDQTDFVRAVAGADPSNCRTGVGIFPLGAPMASEAGLESLRGRHDINLARQEIIQAGYKDERTVVISWADDFASRPSSEVGAEMMRKAGLNVDFQSMDSATGIERLRNRGAVDQGGWSCCFPDWVGLSLRDPAVNPYARGMGANGRPGWATSPRLEELRKDWFAAPDLATQQRIAAEIQVQALTDVTIIPLGLFYDLTAYRTELTGVLPGWPTVFWNARWLS